MVPLRADPVSGTRLFGRRDVLRTRRGCLIKGILLDSDLNAGYNEIAAIVAFLAVETDHFIVAHR
jgi:hypothetical protein